VAASGEQLGIKTLPDALRIAREMDLDLVEVAPMANPPVCRIMDHGKHLYEEAQRLKESRRKSVATSIKEMKYRPKIGKGDFDTKTKHVREFLDEGHKVKVTIMFRGREMHHPELGMVILEQVEAALVDHAKVEAAPKIDGRNMVMVLAPSKKPGKPSGDKKPATPATNATAPEAPVLPETPVTETTEVVEETPEQAGE
jgi:translation initiation factor IF-3